MNKRIIVNKKDEIIGYKYAYQMTKDDLYRVSCLWLTNSQGDILLSQRGFQKHHDPGKWEPAVAGTLEEGETYESNMVKEIEEEIGIKVSITDLKKGPKLFLDQGWQFFCQIFTLTLDKRSEDFTPEKDKVVGVKWYTKDKLIKELKETPEIFTHNFDRIVREMI